jgi:hypothetical protein
VPRPCLPRPWYWLCGAALVAAVAGCAAVPTSGSVHVGRALLPVGGPDNEDVRAFPSGPLVGLTPTGIVAGYLGALVDSDSNYAIARLFLAPGTSWNSTSGITLYDEDSQRITLVGERLVEVHVTQVGVIDSRGDYRVAPRSIDVRFRLVRQSGQWRISHLPSGVLLSTSDAQRSLQSASIYYFNRSQTRLVPSPILVPPDQPGLATTLVGDLLGGPPRPVAPAVVSAVPTHTDLVGNVPIDRNGVAEVNLAGDVQQASALQLQRLSAQIVWTLRQVPSVTAVQLLDNGTPFTDAGVAGVQPIGSWTQFDPESPPTGSGALLSRHGTVAGLGRPVPTSLAGRDLQQPAVSADGATVAALSRRGGRTTLFVGSSLGSVTARLSLGQLSAPAFDPEGNVLLVSGSGPQATVIMVPRHGQPRLVSVSPELQERGISQLAISRDGARIALVVGPVGQRSLVVAALSVAHNALVISGGQEVISRAQDAAGVAWAGANELVTTVRRGAQHRAVVETSVDGYRPHVVTSVGLPDVPIQVAAAPGQPLLAGAAGAIWSLADRQWHRVSTGSDPSYAG